VCINSWADPRTLTCAYRTVSSYLKCPSITSGPSIDILGRKNRTATLAASLQNQRPAKSECRVALSSRERSRLLQRSGAL
jgi:hypothetical protein